MIDVGQIKNLPKLVAGRNVKFTNTDLPDGYEELEYLANGSSTRINTGVKYNVDDIVMEVLVKPTSGSNWRFWHIFTSNSPSDNTGIYGYSSDISWRYNGSNIVTSEITRQSSHLYLIRVIALSGQVTLYVKDMTTGAEDTQTGSYTFSTTNKNFYLFGNSYGTYASSGQKVVYAKMWKTNELVLYYTSSKRVSDNTFGFYDRATSRFITQGNGSLTGGEPVNQKAIHVIGLPTRLSDLTDDLGDSPTHTHSQYLTEHQTIPQEVVVCTLTQSLVQGVTAYSCDKTPADILTAHEGGAVVLMNYNFGDMTIQLRLSGTYHDVNKGYNLVFSCTVYDYVVQAICVTENGNNVWGLKRYNIVPEATHLDAGKLLSVGEYGEYELIAIVNSENVAY